MGETVLRNGEKIDVLNASELRDILQDMLKQLTDANEQSSVFSVEAVLNATVAGVINLTEMFDVTPGYRLTIHRWHINAPGVTPLAPLNAGWLMAFKNDDSYMNMFMFFPVSGAQMAPIVVEEGSSGAFINGGSKVVVKGAGYAAGQALYLSFQCTLELMNPKDT